MSSDRPPEFFLDRSLGKISARRLREAGHVVHLIAEYYPRDAQEVGDAEWIAEGCRRGWILITKDRRIRYRTEELEALTPPRPHPPTPASLRSAATPAPQPLRPSPTPST
jgi:uncharacterized protein with PIN domain